jgi:hypothetical protein
MLFLVGPPIEDRWGRPLFAGFYALAGLASGGFYVLMTPGSPIPLVGASGAIAALMGACLVRFLRTNIRFFYLFFIGFRLIKGTFWAPAWAMLPLWLASELFMAGLTDFADVSSGIAYWAHVGGFGFGALFALGMQKWQIEERFVHGAIEARITLTHNPVIEEAMGAYESGEPERAYDLLARAVGESGDNPDVVDAFFEVASGCKRSEQAALALLPLVRDHLKRGDRELAARYWCQITDQAPDVAGDPALLVRLAPILLAQQQPKKAILALRRAVDAGQTGLTPGMALRVMDLGREIDRGLRRSQARAHRGPGRRARSQGRERASRCDRRRGSGLLDSARRHPDRYGRHAGPSGADLRGPRAGPSSGGRAERRRGGRAQRERRGALSLAGRAPPADAHRTPAARVADAHPTAAAPGSAAAAAGAAPSGDAPAPASDWSGVGSGAAPTSVSAAAAASGTAPARGAAATPPGAAAPAAASPAGRAPPRARPSPSQPRGPRGLRLRSGAAAL